MKNKFNGKSKFILFYSWLSQFFLLYCNDEITIYFSKSRIKAKYVIYLLPLKKFNLFFSVKVIVKNVFDI